MGDAGVRLHGYAKHTRLTTYGLFKFLVFILL